MRDTATFALRHQIDSVMLNILTPAPGTEWFNEMDAEGRVFDRRWDLYDGQHVVMTPLRMTPAELQDEVLAAYRRFYSLRRWLGHVTGRRWVRVRDHAWSWWFVHRWPHDRRNRQYLADLARVEPRQALEEKSAAA